MVIGLGLSNIKDGRMVSIENPSPCENSINDYIVVFSDAAFRMVDGKSNFGYVTWLNASIILAGVSYGPRV